MVMKMNDPTLTDTVVETLTSAEQLHTNANVATITIHPEPNERESCDTSTIKSAGSPTSCENDKECIEIETRQMKIKKSLKLDLTYNNNEKIEDDTINSANSNQEIIDSSADKDDSSFKSPTSPRVNDNARVKHQTSVTSQVEVVDDRKALRDALYQGIFHRHRRTIFAVGSFLRMLKSRNSQYNTIRSSSEGEDDNAR